MQLLFELESLPGFCSSLSLTDPVVAVPPFLSSERGSNKTSNQHLWEKKRTALRSYRDKSSVRFLVAIGDLFLLLSLFPLCRGQGCLPFAGHLGRNSLGRSGIRFESRAPIANPNKAADLRTQERKLSEGKLSA